MSISTIPNTLVKNIESERLLIRVPVAHQDLRVVKHWRHTLVQVSVFV